MSIWHTITTDDMKWFKQHLSQEQYWKLSHQCRARIPMLKSVYNILKKRYDKLQN